MVHDADAIRIDGIVWDDDIDAHFERHEVRLDDVLAVLAGEPLTLRNVEGRGGTHVLIGRTSAVGSSTSAFA